MDKFIKGCWNLFLAFSAAFVSIFVLAGVYALIKSAYLGDFMSELLVVCLIIAVLYSCSFPTVHTYIKEMGGLMKVDFDIDYVLSRKVNIGEEFHVNYHIDHGTVFVWKSPNGITYFVQIKQQAPDFDSIRNKELYDAVCIESGSHHYVDLRDLLTIPEYQKEVRNEH